jgi:tetratricopeptide (TPR) repeat protein
MPEQMPFIGRENELTQIREAIQEWGIRRVICIDGLGGIGKTRLLQEIRRLYSSSLPGKINQEVVTTVPLVMTDIIDFDDHTFRVVQNFDLKIAHMLDERNFEPYLSALQKWREILIKNASQEQLVQQSVINQAFMNCFNTVSAQQRVVMLWDTTDSLVGTDILSHIIGLAPQLENSVLLIAGRNAKSIGERLQTEQGEQVQLITLPPLEAETSELYLQQKQNLLHISLEPDLARTILLLAQGRPILIDLAIEWLSRAIPLDWLIESNPETLKLLSDEELRQRQEDFEAHLVRHIIQIRTPMDRLTLAMSRVYPLNVELIVELLKAPEDEAKQLFEEAKSYVFVKLLPDGRISLHDEMRRLVNEHVWPEVDPDDQRRQRDSKLALNYLEQKIEGITGKVNQLKQEEKMVSEGANASVALRSFLAREALEQQLWSLKGDQLKHTLAVDLDEGVKRFASVFDEATSGYRFSFRQTLLAQVHEYNDQLSPEQRYELNSRRVKYLIDGMEYDEAKKLVTQILERDCILPEQQVDLLIQRGNAEIRLGDVKSVKRAVSDFKRAIKISETNNLHLWLIKAKNGLGWVYRLQGKLDLAKKYYREAKTLCQAEGVFGVDYGWILNNLTFVMAYQDRQNAIKFGQAALEHWRKIRNAIGLGAAYIVLGSAYHQNGHFHEALASFQEALNIFEPLELNYWLGQIYSWRGSTHLRLGQLTEAKRDLKKALKIGSPNMEAMTLNRLGRVYLAQEKWDLAEGYFEKSYKRSQEILEQLGYSFGSLAKLIMIAAKKGQYNRIDEFEQAIKTCKVRTSDSHDLGDAYFSMATLALGQKDIKRVIEYLEKGITLVTEAGVPGRADSLNKLTKFEKNFEQIAPETIRQIGQRLKDILVKKETENIEYGAVTPITYRWANWAKEETHEPEQHVSA